ncbi:hypothetical protein [Maridesulfovibrio sp.]|uniref:preprotein translocase subunit SecA n=1 Tax=Maridesulfovibrio sp. TaxID=2795000 RepID=UPI002A18BE76|nr:hypothetical protein [Maridesulfovibrio sp.]
MFGKFFGNREPGYKILKKYAPLVKEVLKKRSLLAKRSASYCVEQLEKIRRGKAQQYTNMTRVQKEAVLSHILAFVCHLSKDILGLSPKETQVIASLAMYDGHVIEMNNGEGKTLAAAIAAILHYIIHSNPEETTNCSIHIVTAHEFLAKRDAFLMEPLYTAINITISVIGSSIENNHSDNVFISNYDDENKKKAYRNDIVYSSATNLCFDFLKDNLKFYKEQVCQRSLDFIILDEIDFILIDNGGSLHTISNHINNSEQNINKATFSSRIHKIFHNDKYTFAALLVKNMRPDDHYNINFEDKSILIKSASLKYIGKKLKGEELLLFSDMLSGLIPLMEKTLVAKHFYKEGENYSVQSGQILPLDENGRILDDQEFPDGLRQALELRHGFSSSAESKVVARISIQHYFMKYTKMAGMSGTIKEYEDELREIYGAQVVCIPSCFIKSREDLPDKIFASEKELLAALMRDVKKRFNRGQPVLINTQTGTSAERISMYLANCGIANKVLDAKNHREESAIIAQAGQLKAVTISAMMAGRGTDIRLGEGVEKLGGLHVIGVQRNEEARSDRQLRGRAGRHGKPGSSQFYISNGCDLLKRARVTNVLRIIDDNGLESRAVTRALSRVQKKVRRVKFENRKKVYEMDSILNGMRNRIYVLRKLAMDADSEGVDVLLDRIIKNVVRRIERPSSQDAKASLSDIKNIEDFINDELGAKSYNFPSSAYNSPNVSDLNEWACSVLTAECELLREKSDYYAEIIRYFLIASIDQSWASYLQSEEQLKSEMSWQQLGASDAMGWFASMSERLFEEMLADVERSTLTTLLHLRIE